MKCKLLLLAAAVSGLMTGCGSDNDSSQPATEQAATSGFVIDGYLDKAEVCLDTNNDLSCVGEPYKTTSVNGRFRLEYPQSLEGRYAIVASAIAGVTIDLDSPSAPIANSFSLIAPASVNMVTPISTQVAYQMRAFDLSLSEATLKVKNQLGLSSDNIFENFIETNNQELNQAAKRLIQIQLKLINEIQLYLPTIEVSVTNVPSGEFLETLLKLSNDYLESSDNSTDPILNVLGEDALETLGEFIKYANPVNPTDPIDPTNPTDPIDPTDPTDPVGPVPTNPLSAIDILPGSDAKAITGAQFLSYSNSLDQGVVLSQYRQTLGVTPFVASQLNFSASKVVQEYNTAIVFNSKSGPFEEQPSNASELAVEIYSLLTSAAIDEPASNNDEGFINELPDNFFELSDAKQVELYKATLTGNTRYKQCVEAPSIAYFESAQGVTAQITCDNKTLLAHRIAPMGANTASAKITLNGSVVNVQPQIIGSSTFTNYYLNSAGATVSIDELFVSIVKFNDTNKDNQSCDVDLSAVIIQKDAINNNGVLKLNPAGTRLVLGQTYSNPPPIIGATFKPSFVGSDDSNNCNTDPFDADPDLPLITKYNTFDSFGNAGRTRGVVSSFSDNARKLSFTANYDASSNPSLPSGKLELNLNISK